MYFQLFVRWLRVTDWFELGKEVSLDVVSDEEVEEEEEEADEEVARIYNNR